MHGGAADRSGLIHPGDEVIEVNGIDVLGKTPNDVLEILVHILARALSISSYLNPFRGRHFERKQQIIARFLLLFLYQI